MSGNKFKIGDIVKLNAGGPSMSVTEVKTLRGDGPTVWCKWFGGKKLETGSFPEDTLILVDEKEIGGNG